MLVFGTPVCILSPLSPEECTRRLHAIAASKQAVSASQVDFVVRGKVSPTSCWFKPHKVLLRRGDPSYRTLALKIIPAPGGTILQGELGTPFLELLITTVLFAVVFGLAARMFSETNTRNPMPLFFPLLYVCFAILGVVMNFVRRSKPEPRLLEFIRSTVQGVLHKPAPKPH